MPSSGPAKRRRPGQGPGKRPSARASNADQREAAERERLRQERRDERRRAEDIARLHRRRRWVLRQVALAALAVTTTGAALFFLLRPDPEVAGVERPSSAGRTHVAVGVARYDTATPTSGDHPTRAPVCGTTTEPLDPELAVHALEHGVVVVWYQADLADELRGPLDDLADEWDSHVIVSPNDDIDDKVVATAWNRRKAFAGPGEDVRDFVDTYRRRGPEREACPS